jgi:predicted metal-dependent HD superfamily phosphohydrolase
VLLARGNTLTPAPGRIVREASRFVRRMFRQRLPAWVVYHSFNHTVRTVAAAESIGKRTALGVEELDILRLAAWFHDTGYLTCHRGHEEKSAAVAVPFLRARSVPERTIDRVVRCILATRMPQKPRSVLERVLCDADMVSLGTTDFFMLDRRMKREVERRERRVIPVLEWLIRSEHLLARHRFHSPYGRKALEKGRRENLRILREYLRPRTIVGKSR